MYLYTHKVTSTLNRKKMPTPKLEFFLVGNGLRKNILLPGNTLLPCSESNPKCFYNEISLCRPSPTTHHSPVPSPSSQVNVPRKQSSLHLKCFLFLPSPSRNALFFCPNSPSHLACDTILDLGDSEFLENLCPLLFPAPHIILDML